jgi:alpha-1,6-mannosyltransferase
MLTQPLRLSATSVVGVAMCGLLWFVFSGPFPLAEFCTRRRPTWVLGLFDTPRYTAVTGPVFLAALVALTALYLTALWLVLRAERPLPGGQLTLGLLLVVVPLGLVAALLPGYPLLSSDIFKYIFDGRIMVVYHENPFIKVPADYPDDRFYDLVYWKAVVNAHGPIWRVLEAISAQVGGERCENAVLAMKLWPALAYLATVGVLFRMLRAAWPQRALPLTLAYAWCPLVVLEAIQNGHNDVVAALPVLLALWAARADRWPLAVVLVAAGFLVKPLAAVAGPALLVAAWRAGPRPFRDLIIGAGVAAGLVLLAYAPFYAGIDTFQGMERGSIFSASPGELAVIALEAAGWPLDRAMLVARLLAGGGFATLALAALWAVWQRRLGLAGGLGAVLFAYLLLGSQWFNPWYLLWLLPVALLTPDWRLRALAVIFALLAPLTYLLQYDARLVVPAVFVPMALLAVVWRGALGLGGGSQTAGSEAASPEPTGASSGTDCA